MPRRGTKKQKNKKTETQTKVRMALRSLEQFRTEAFLHIKSTAVQRCARRSTEFASGSNIVGESREEMENPLVTQGSTHRGFCSTFPLCMYV